MPPKRQAASATPPPAPDSMNERRLVIHQIVVENFKSYAGKHIIGPFHTTFTAIIGPNGSGKSNVIDSMLFVFGKTAKKLRLDKLSELIHNSAAHPNLSRASVQVDFVEQRRIPRPEGEPPRAPGADPRDDWETIEDTELNIKREVLRSGISQYYINDRKATQKEVVSTLTEKGVDLDHNRFLILQGEVEQIALMKPKAEREGEEGLLEYFDDLIGTTSYVGRIQELAAQAEALQEQRLALLDQVKKMESVVRSLSDAKDQTLQFASKDNHVQTLLGIMCLKKIALIEQELVEPRSRMAGIQQSADRLVETMKQVGTQEHDAKVARDAAKDEVRRVEQALSNLGKTKLAAEEKIASIKAGNDESEKAKKKEADKFNNLRKDLAKLTMQVEEYQRDITIAQSSFSEAQTKLEKLEPEYEKQTDALQQALKPLRQKKEALEKKAAPVNAQVTAAEEALNDAKHNLDNYLHQQEMRKEEAQRTRREIEEKTAQRDQKQKIISDFEAQSQDGQEEKSLELERELIGVTQEKKALDQQISSLKQEFKDDEAEDKVMKFLVEQRNLPGYYGQLRQLGRIDDRYDIAAGVASFMWTSHIVDSDKTAAICLELLKKNDIGRANFIIIEKIAQSERAKKMDTKFKAPKGSTRLFDLIKPTEGKFAVAFYHAVHDTLVVDSVANARRLAMEGEDGRRYRVVTIAGELCEPTGSMQGGGKTPQGARLKAAHAPADKARVKAQLIELQGQLNAKIKEEEALQNRIYELGVARSKRPTFTSAQLSQMKGEVGLLTGIVEAKQETLNALNEEIKNFERSPEAIAQQRELKRRIDTAEKELEKSQKQQLLFTEQLEKLDEEMTLVGGENYAQLKTNVEAEKRRLAELDEKLNALRTNMRKAETAKTRKETETSKAEERLKQLEREQEDTAKEEMSKLEKKVAECKVEGDKLQLEQKDARAKNDTAQKHVDDFAEQIRKAKTQVEDLMRQKEEVAATISAQQSQLDRYSAKITDCEEKIQSNIENFGIETLQEDQGRPGDDEDEEDGDVAPSRKKSRHEATQRNSTQHRSANPYEAQPYKIHKTPEELEAYDFAHIRLVAQELSAELERIRDTIDIDAVQRWREKDEEYKAVREQYDDVVAQVHDSESSLEQLKTERKTLFLKSFALINRKLKEMYQMITDGGDAEVELVDAQDPFEGISFVVRPPRKSWKQVSNLSGGEKTLSSLALVFALHHVRPCPIYVMDEIDAALDFRNVSIVARYILEQAVGAQFIIISLRNNMFELAHRLVGISKVKDCTQSVAIDPKAAAEKVLSISRRGAALTNASPNRQQQLKRPRESGTEIDGEDDTAAPRPQRHS